MLAEQQLYCTLVQHLGKSPVHGQQPWLVRGNSLGEHKAIEESFSCILPWFFSYCHRCSWEASWAVSPFFDYCIQELSLNDIDLSISWQALSNNFRYSALWHCFSNWQEHRLLRNGQRGGCSVDGSSRNRFKWVRVEVVCKEDYCTSALISRAWN